MSEDFLNHDVAQVFLQARYRDVVDLTYERVDWSHEDETAPISIAALAFVGRIEEAKTVLNLALKSKSLDIHQRIFASFYLATSLTRHGHYAEARKLLSEIFWLRHKMHGIKNAMVYRSEFFIAQGLAFFRFVGGYYHQADRHAKNATERALLAKFPYGRVLALDLQGHCLHHLGQHRESLQIMDDAMRLAQKLSLSSLADNIMLQRELFVMRFSVDLTAPRKRLEELTQQVRFQNSYSQAVLFLELTRAALMQGRLGHARKLLLESAEHNNVRGDRRLHIQQDLRQALTEDMAGNSDEAKDLLKSVLDRLDPDMDIVFEMHALGHLARLNNTSTDAIQPLATRSGRYLARRISARTKSDLTPATYPLAGNSQDQLGETLDRIAGKDPKRFKQLCAQGSPGLAVRTFKLAEGQPQFLGIFADTREFIIADHGEISFQSSALTELMMEVLKAIASGQGSLESLATNVWKARDYHPLRHDPKIYRVLSKLRAMFGESAHWIKTTSSGYILAPGVAILIIQNDGSIVELRSGDTPLAAEGFSTAHTLTDRIHRYIGEKGRVTNRDIVAEFRISSVTSARELTKLVKDRKLKRMGAGRSTTYVAR